MDGAGAHGVHAIPIASEALEELERATKKFGAFHNAHEGYAVLLEEMDELWEEVKKHRSPANNLAMRREAIQVAAMAMRFVYDVGGDSGGHQ